LGLGCCELLVRGIAAVWRMATHNRNAAVDGMTRAEQIVRFFLENSEHYKWEGEPLTKPNATGEYICEIGPSGPLLSIEHREKRVKLWTAAFERSGL
jgi:hypothetical protein